MEGLRRERARGRDPEMAKILIRDMDGGDVID